MDSRSQGIPTTPLPIIGQYNIQRFKQFSPEDSANFYVVNGGQDTKGPYAMYPALGRQHINYLGINKLIFPGESRGLFHSVDFWYNVVGDTIYRIDKNYNVIDISQGKLLSDSTNIFFTYLVVFNITFSCFVDDQKIYISQENKNSFDIVTDPNAPGNFTINDVLTKPGFIANFGNRITVSVANSAQFVLSVVNLLNPNGIFDAAHCFSIGYNPVGPVAGQQLFAQENGIIRQMGVLNNTLFIYTDFTTGLWANIPAVFSGTNVSFPWKKNTTFEWNFGIADPVSLSIGFDLMTFLGKNSEGLLQVMSSSGGEPERISSKAIDTLFQQYANQTTGSPFLEGNADGFLYQYENSIFYRLSAGKFNDFGILDLENSANSIEYNFESKTWARVIELNGERNRIQKHVFFNNQHLVSVGGEGTIYEFSGKFYTNELINIEQDNSQESDAYIKYPMRYERVTQIIFEKDYSEFETEYIEIDFVFGESNISQSETPFSNAVFLIDESSDPNNPTYLVADKVTPPYSIESPTFLLAEGGNTPSLDSITYNDLYKPYIEIYFSDDGGITYSPADVREYAQMGQYQWRMRWYQLGCSRNRVYKLIAVSPVPIVVLGGCMIKKRSSGGGN